MQYNGFNEAYTPKLYTPLLDRYARNINALKKVRGDDFTDVQALKLARLLDTCQRELDHCTRLYDATQPSDVGPFKTHALSLISAVMPNLIAEELVSVQP